MTSRPDVADLARNGIEGVCRQLAGSGWSRMVLEQLLLEAAAPLHERGWQAAVSPPLQEPNRAAINDQESLVSLRAWTLQDRQTGMLAHLRAVMVNSLEAEDFGWGRLYVEVVRVPDEVCGDNEVVGRLASAVVMNVPALGRAPRPDEKFYDLLLGHFRQLWGMNQEHIRRQAFAFMAAQLDDALAP